MVYYTPLAGERFRFICARVDLASATAEYLEKLLRTIVRELSGCVEWRNFSISIMPCYYQYHYYDYDDDYYYFYFYHYY